MKISIIGSGLVGVAIGKGLVDLGNEVIFCDVVNKNLPNFTKDIDYAIESTNISFVCVPTPTQNHRKCSEAIVDFTLERRDLGEEKEKYLWEIGKGGEV